MHFPKFWTRVRRGGVFAWGWSDVSTAEARADGESRLSRIIARLTDGEHSEKSSNRYGYPDRPMREEVLQEFSLPVGSAMVTRNSYGCLVLNTTHALFVDIDEPAPNVLRSLASLFGKKASFDDRVLEQACHWVNTHRGWGWRVYRTKAGIRLLATHHPIPAEDAMVEKVFHEFQADILYRKLCVNQKCYRARLTPKSWRCGIERPTKRWPWTTTDEETKFRQWERAYQAAAASYATCRFLSQIGQDEFHPALAALIAFHDQGTGAESTRPLA